MPQQFTFKSYVPKAAPEAKQRAAGTKLPTRTDTSGKIPAPGDGLDAPRRAVIQHRNNAPGLGVDEFVRSSGIGEETVTVCSPSAVLDTESPLPEVVQGDSVPPSQTEDFEQWLRQDKPYPEQPGNKRTQQPTPEYDDSDTEDARRKRPRLAREVCRNTLVDSGASEKSALVERPVATQTQRSSWDQRAADLDRRAANMDQRAADLDKRAAEMDQRAASMDQRAAEMDQQALDMDGRAAEVWQRPLDLEERPADDEPLADLHEQARAPSRQPTRAGNQTVARQRRDMYADEHFADSEDSESEDGASVRANEEDAGHQLKAPHSGRGRLSQNQNLDLIRWRDEGEPLDWIAKQLNRREENIPGLEKRAREMLG